MVFPEKFERNSRFSSFPTVLPSNWTAPPGNQMEGAGSQEPLHSLQCLAGAGCAQILSHHIFWNPLKLPLLRDGSFSARVHFIVKELPSMRHTQPAVLGKSEWCAASDLCPSVRLRKCSLVDDVNLLYHPLFLASKWVMNQAIIRQCAYRHTSGKLNYSASDITYISKE